MKEGKKLEGRSFANRKWRKWSQKAKQKKDICNTKYNGYWEKRPKKDKNEKTMKN